MNKDLENATKAAQCASLLCSNLHALAGTDNLVLSDIALQHLTDAQNLSARLDRLADRLKKMDAQARHPHLVS